MPREPNQTEARGMWDVTRPNQQRNAIYGERWPLTYVPGPPLPDVLFTRSSLAGWGASYSGTNNLDGSLFYPQYNPGWVGWGYGSGQYLDGLGFQVSGGGGQHSQFILNWIYLPTIYTVSTGNTVQVSDVQFEIRICTGHTPDVASRVYEHNGTYQPTPAADYDFKPYHMPQTGNVYGSTLLNFNTIYQFNWHVSQALVVGASSWTAGFGGSMTNYMSANQNPHNVSFSGQTYVMTWYDAQNWHLWNGYSNLGTGTWGGTMGSGFGVTFV